MSVELYFQKPLSQRLHHSGQFTLPAPCCSPKSLEPISVLYIDGLDAEGEVVLREDRMEETLASSCGCG